MGERKPYHLKMSFQMLKPACVQHSTSVKDFFQLDCKTTRTFLTTLSITLADIGYSVALLIFHTISHMFSVSYITKIWWKGDLFAI